jgi:hypothetical protein
MSGNTVPDPVSGRIIEFLRGIGLEVKVGEVHGETFLPGITIDHGALVVDPSRWKYPGDLLHEAGHLAVMPAERRRKAHRTAGKKAAEEMMAIAWSYAAAVHLGVPPEVVFHADGYRGGSASLVENFTQGRYLGVPTLQWLGMTADHKRAEELGVAPYPAMIRWLNGS